jgi:UDP-N-acetylmuramyl tripeptide synthase
MPGVVLHATAAQSGLAVPVLQHLLAGMRDRGATSAVLEVDSEAQATGSLQWVEPTIAVFTNLGDDPGSMFSSREVSISSCA